MRGGENNKERKKTRADSVQNSQVPSAQRVAMQLNCNMGTSRYNAVGMLLMKLRLAAQRG